MTLVATWLLSVALADIVGAGSAQPRSRRAVLALLAGVGATLLLLLLLGTAPRSAAWLAAASSVPLAVWLRASREGSSGSWNPAWGLAVMAAVLCVLLATTAAAPEAAGALARWYGDLAVPALAGVPLERFLMGLAALAFLQATSNRLVRLVLRATGSPLGLGESTLRGGRLLGPMERTFLFGLALGGELTAAAVIVAAKGALRFPEIQAAERPSGVSGVTEYFLIGTLSSMLLALSMVVLV
jgi:hypothetical protein